MGKKTEKVVLNRRELRVPLGYGKGKAFTFDDRVVVGIQHVEGCEDIPFPVYKTTGSVGADIHAAISYDNVQSVRVGSNFEAVKGVITLKPGEIKAIPTGLRFSLPVGWEAQIRPRSGMALNHGITVLNSPGTIDSDWRGENKVILMNLSKENFDIRRGDRIAQVVFAPAFQVDFQELEELDVTERGDKGFGSTGGFSGSK